MTKYYIKKITNCNKH